MFGCFDVSISTVSPSVCPDDNELGLVNGVTTVWEKAAHSVYHKLSLYFDLLWFWLFSHFGFWVGLWFWLRQFLVVACLLLLKQNH